MAVAIDFDTGSMADYQRFMQIKRIPAYHFRGSRAIVPDEYAATLGISMLSRSAMPYQPSEFLMDYQADIARFAIRKQKYAVFMEPGRGNMQHGSGNQDCYRRAEVAVLLGWLRRIATESDAASPVA